MNQKGFTLLEVLISITLLSYIMVSVVGVTTDSINTKDRVTQEDRVNYQVETAMSQLKWDFSQIYSPMYFAGRYQKPWVPPGGDRSKAEEVFNSIMTRYSGGGRFPFPSSDGLPIPRFELDKKNTFTFFTSSNRRKIEDQKQSHFAWVMYTVESFEGDDGEGSSSALVRYYLPDDPFSKEDLDFSKVKGHVLMENVVGLQFLFWDREGRKWVDSLDIIRDGEHVLRGMQVKLTWRDANDAEIDTIRTFRPLIPFFEVEDLNKLAQEDYKKYAPKGSQPQEPTQ
jgi:prepilin-type N-terminal cleavage/methylation domain-containing protein